MQVACNGGGFYQGATHANGANGLPVDAGTAYTLSATVKAVSGSGAVALSLVWFNASGAFLSISFGSTFAPPASPQRTVLTATAPANAAFATPVLSDIVGVSQTLTFTVDGWQLEAGSAASGYCDGAVGAGFAWTGIAHASPSTRAASDLSMRVPPGAGVRGAVAVWLRPRWAGPGSVGRTALEWAGDTGDGGRLCATSAGNWRWGLTGGGVTDAVELPVTHAADGAVLLIAEWTERTIALTVGTSFASAARTGAPAPAFPVSAQIGRRQGTSVEYIEAAVGPIAWYRDATTPSLRRVLNRLTKPPRWEL